jgi:hypothetical protein
MLVCIAELYPFGGTGKKPHPTRCPGVPRMFLTAPHAATALGLHYGQGEQCLHA